MKKLMRLLTGILLISMLFMRASAYTITREQTEVLRHYKIFQGDETGNLNLDTPITRAELCKILCAAQGYADGEYVRTDEIIADVPSTHWAYPFFVSAKALSLIPPDENGYFYPESNMTNQELIKAMVSLLGYTPLAEDMGGFPQGYYDVAKRLQFVTANECKPKEYALRGDAAKWIYRALDIPLMCQTGYGEVITYGIMDGSGNTSLDTLRLRLKSVD